MTALASPARLTRDILRLTGAEVIPFLQGLVTANVEGLASGASTLAALLTPQGKILWTFFLTRDDEGVFLETAAGDGAALLKRLSLYKLRAKVEITDVTADYAVCVGGDLPAGALGGQDARLDGLGARWISLAADSPEAVGDDALRLLEITHGVPSFRRDYDAEAVFPLDVNLDALAGIDHKKGCFVGQEVASRMFRKGEIRKRTYIVRGDALSPGTDLKAGASTVGTITSALGNVGLAVIRLDRLAKADGGAITTDNGAAVTVEKPSYLP